MDELNITIILGLMFFGFFAAFIDSVVGGGGLISIPALMFFGLDTVAAIGTNKVSASMGSIIGFLTYVKAGKVRFSLIKNLLPLAFVGSIFGGITLSFVPADFLRPLVVFLLIFITIYTIFKKNFGQVTKVKKETTKRKIIAMVLFTILGFYDGFFGPGTGTFMLFALLWMGLDFVSAAGSSRGLNFASNIAGAIYFIYAGIVNYHYALPMGIAMIIGAYLGAKMAMGQGVYYVKILFIMMTTILIGKQLIDLFSY